MLTKQQKKNEIPNNKTERDRVIKENDFLHRKDNNYHYEKKGKIVNCHAICSL